MEYKLLEQKDLVLMKDFIDDENTKYNIKDLCVFINEKIHMDLLLKKMIK